MTLICAAILCLSEYLTRSVSKISGRPLNRRVHRAYIMSTTAKSIKFMIPAYTAIVGTSSGGRLHPRASLLESLQIRTH